LNNIKIHFSCCIDRDQWPICEV